MIQQRMCVPVFFYAYKPFLDKQFPEDSGFSITLFENGVLVYCRFVNQNTCAERRTFLLDPGIYHEYRSVLEPSLGWLSVAPGDLRNGEPAAFASCFAFDGIEPIHVWNPDSMSREPFGSANGVWARRLCLLFEEVAILLARYGIGLSLDNFYWNPALINPVIIPEYATNTSLAN